jgi:tetratricopeptide (TPR) repeat protein
MIEPIKLITKAAAKDVLKISENERIDRNLENFKNYCYGISKPKGKSDILYLQDNLVHTENDCLKAEKGEDFCFAMSGVAENFMRRGFFNLSSIFFTRLAKICIGHGKIDDGIMFTQKALTIYHKNGDKAHYEARLTDLEKLYKKSGSNQELYFTLKEKTRILADILENYDATAENYRSLTRPFPDINKFHIQMARAKSDIGDLLLHKNRPRALEYYSESIGHYQQAGCEKEAEFIQYRMDYPDRIKFK